MGSISGDWRAGFRILGCDAEDDAYADFRCLRL